MDVEVYAEGLFCCSVCSPADMDARDVEARVNTLNPSGTRGGWKLSTDKTFSGGEPNGGIFECSRGVSRHWLLEAS